MDEINPFSDYDLDRTIIKPLVGHPARMPTPTDVAAAPLSAPVGHVELPEVPASFGLNPLLQLASPLLVTGTRLRAMVQHANVSALRTTLVGSVRKFEADARARGLPNEQVVAGRYLLCTFIDECVSSTPWGGSGAWSAHSLQVLFHNESLGGEKLFQLLGKLAENVHANTVLLELIYVILALGFEGRYRVLADGRAQLDGVREKLALMLREQSGTAMQELSPRWAGSSVEGRHLRDGIPMGLVATTAAMMLALIFLVLRLLIAGHTDDVFTMLQTLNMRAATVSEPFQVPILAMAATPRLSGFLKPEIESGAVDVRDLADRSIITLRGDGFFNPGSAEVSSKVLPLLERIADELARIPGQVLVTGHTDSQPIRSLRFPSNWHLSQERAQTVRDILAVKVKSERVRFEGLADTQPVGDNATPDGRSKNRRVEITLRLDQSGG